MAHKVKITGRVDGSTLIEVDGERVEGVAFYTVFQRPAEDGVKVSFSVYVDEIEVETEEAEKETFRDAN